MRWPTGDRMLAVIRGTAVNQDGRSSGLTAPNGPPQEAVIREALAQRRACSRATSTTSRRTARARRWAIRSRCEALGGGVREQERARRSRWLIGSVKTNIGHLEAAAGMAGLIKVVLALQHGQIPPHLHFQQPNPHIAWERYADRVPTAVQAVEGGGKAAIAGVSSFGFSGTNAHVVLEEAPASRT